MGCICTRNSNRVRPILVSQLAPDNCSKLQVPEVENTTQRSIRRFFSPQIFRSVGRVCPQNAQFENQIGTSPEELWSEVDKGCHPSKKSHIARDQAWKTVHIYVASTFCDFHAERAVLASEVFPQIAKWCGSASMQLVSIDLRWGLSKELQTTDYLLTCLKEIERCSEDNMPVFFLALLSETLGWVPSHEYTHSVFDQYDWVQGMSLIEMEIIQAAYRSINQNAMFLLRESSFLLDLPDEHCHHYADPQARDRLDILKSKLRTKFPEQVFTYHCRVLSEGAVTKVEPNSYFKNAVAEFFINRIQKEFSQETVPRRLLTVQNEQQKQELERLCLAELLGKGSCLDKILAYVESPDSCSPLLLVGELGSGKSTIIARCIQLYLAKQQRQLQQRANYKLNSPVNLKARLTMDSSSHRILSEPNMEITSADRRGLRSTRAAAAKKTTLLQQDEDTTSVESIPLVDCPESVVPSIKPADNVWHVFYHFVCSIPRSAELRHILQRMWAIESLGEPRTTPMKPESNALAKDIYQMLSKCGRKRFLLFIDGIDRIKDEYHSNVLKWIPAKLPETVRVVVSLSPNGETRKIFGSREPKCAEVQCGSLSLALSRQLISNKLASHKLTVSTKLLDILLSKLDVCNPHYIVEVCNELAWESRGDNLQEIAAQIPGDLGGLYDRIISRLEDEGRGRLVIAALCLLECSHYGLQEPELLDMLGALTPSGYYSDSDNLSRGSGSERHQAVHRHSGPHEIHGGIGHEQLGVYPPRTESSLFGGGSRQNSWSQLRSPAGAASHEDFEEYGDHEITASKGPRASIHSHDYPKSSPSHSPMLPGAIEASADELKLSPKSAKKHHIPHSVSFPCAQELTANRTVLSVSVSPEASPSMSNLRKPSKLPPSPSLSILSAELAHILRKSSSHSELELERAEVEIQEIGPVNSSDHHSTKQILSNSRIKPAVVSLERMNAIQFGVSEHAPKLQSYIWGRILHQLRPFLKAVGRQGETRLAVGTKALSRAIRKRYFKQPPTQTFPFSFCSSPTFYGADKDQTLRSVLTSNRTTTATNAGTHSLLSSPVNMGVGFTASRTGNTMQGPDLVHKRFGWWHARLAGYFATSSNEDRRAEELPYHLARIQDYGRLSHCLVHFPVFERLSDPENVMDLLRFWRCAGGYSNAVLRYHHALDELEISGASGQEMVCHMQKVALFLQKAGEAEAAQQILVDAIELEETRLGGRLESMANLTLHITEILSQYSQQQAQYLEPRQSLESEYRLLQFASRSVEFHRRFPGGDQVEHNLALLLMLLSIHLLHYASLGGSAALSARNAQEEAQETAQEAAEIYVRLEDYGQLLEAYLHLASTYNSIPRRALEILEEAKQICSKQFGELNDMMLRILFSSAVILECRLSLYDTAEKYYRKWVELTIVMYGEDHSTVAVARECLAKFLAAHLVT